MKFCLNWNSLKLLLKNLGNNNKTKCSEHLKELY